MKGNPRKNIYETETNHRKKAGGNLIGAAFVTHPFDLWFFFDLRMEIVDLAKKVKLLQLRILLK